MPRYAKNVIPSNIELSVACSIAMQFCSSSSWLNRLPYFFLNSLTTWFLNALFLLFISLMSCMYVIASGIILIYWDGPPQSSKWILTIDLLKFVLLGPVSWIFFQIHDLLYWFMISNSQFLILAKISIPVGSLKTWIVPPIPHRIARDKSSFEVDFLVLLLIAGTLIIWSGIDNLTGTMLRLYLTIGSDCSCQSIL